MSQGDQLPNLQFESLSKIYLKLENKGLTTKNGGIADQRISYCRGKDLKKVFDLYKEEIAKDILEILNEDIGPKGSDALNNFYKM